MPKPSTISVVGQGRAHGAPDVCRVHLAATALRPSVAVALADGEATARRIREALAAGGVAPADAATGTVTIRPEEDYSGPRGPRLLGYRADHGLEIVLRDLGTAGRLLGDAVAAGGDAVRLQGVEFTLEDDTQLRSAARAAAWEDARRAAEQLAGLAGRPLGAVRRVDEGRGVELPVRPLRMDFAASAAPEVGLQSGGVSVEVSLGVVWELG